MMYLVNRIRKKRKPILEKSFRQSPVATCRNRPLRKGSCFRKGATGAAGRAGWASALASGGPDGQGSGGRSRGPGGGWGTGSVLREWVGVWPAVLGAVGIDRDENLMQLEDFS